MNNYYSLLFINLLGIKYLLTIIMLTLKLKNKT